MGKILFVNACVRPDSRTLVLAKHVLGQMEGDFHIKFLVHEKRQVAEISSVHLPSLNLLMLYYHCYKCYAFL